ncbi:MAG: D-glycero-beta-D-manno-heptose 1-phosphate adenylyltransferase [Chitinophagales bacterium]|nr:D-glycero-beta-D-manno-heptose 1-phosphate adenylyltransferase [Chitinophagales bacterium]
MHAEKIFFTEELLTRISFWRTTGDVIVFTNGCFDILHPGHVHLLHFCRQHGDRVIVGLNSDASVRRLKGDKRPLNHEKSRATVLAALLYTDAIVLFDDDTPEALIREIKPDVLVKGGDWKPHEVAGAQFVKSYGGRVEIAPYLEGYSTTSILAKIQ